MRENARKFEEAAASGKKSRSSEQIIDESSSLFGAFVRRAREVIRGTPSVASDP